LLHFGPRSDPLRPRFGRGTAVTGWTGDTGRSCRASSGPTISPALPPRCPMSWGCATWPSRSTTYRPPSTGWPQTARPRSAASVSTSTSGAWPTGADRRGSSWPWPSGSVDPVVGEPDRQHLRDEVVRSQKPATASNKPNSEWDHRLIKPVQGHVLAHLELLYRDDRALRARPRRLGSRDHCFLSLSGVTLTGFQRHALIFGPAPDGPQSFSRFFHRLPSAPPSPGAPAQIGTHQRPTFPAAEDGRRDELPEQWTWGSRTLPLSSRRSWPTVVARS
jgi:hypothetical protein